MKIKVLKDTSAASCPMGISIKEYKAGEVYEIFDSLAEIFISQDWGVKESGEKAFKIKLENKAIESASEDKSEEAIKPKKKSK